MDLPGLACRFLRVLVDQLVDGAGVRQPGADDSCDVLPLERQETMLEVVQAVEFSDEPDPDVPGEQLVVVARFEVVRRFADFFACFVRRVA